MGRIAAFIAAILAGLIPNPNSVEEIEPHLSNNVPSIEKVFSNQEFNSLEKNGRQVILVKSGDSVAPSNVPSRQGQGPSNFPTPPSGARPSRNVPGVNPYRATPRVVNQRLGAAANPAGAGNGGGNSEFDDIRSIPDKQNLDKNNPEHPSFYSKKRQSED